MTGDQLLATCTRCKVTAKRRGVCWAEGYVCRRCYQRATRVHGVCPRCDQQRMLPGLDAGGTSICGTCAGIEQDFACTRCGEEDEPYRRGLCARCSLRDDLSQLLDDGTGHVRAELTGLFDAICAQQHPRSALIWLRNPAVGRLLAGIARGELALTHETLDAEPAQRTAMHLRELFMRYGALPEHDRVILQFQAWLQRKAPGYSPAAARLLTGFATWHHLRRMRELSEAGKLTPGAAHTAKQEISVAGQLLTHLESAGTPFRQVRQTQLDAWLAVGPSTRYTARTFVVWAVKSRHLPALRFPHRQARRTPVLSQDERLDLLHRFLHSDEKPAAYRLAAVLLLLYAQPLTRIARLRLEDVSFTDALPKLRFGAEPAELPPPVADLLQHHLERRPNTNTAANAGSPWLFPGYSPGQPLHPSYLMKQVRQAGVPLLAARNGALRQLVLDMPPAVAAQALGYSPQVAESHARNAGATWSTYASRRSSGPASRSETP